MEKARRGMIGIYQLKNVRTGEQFIGSAPSIPNHFKKHLDCLAANSHPNAKLQQSWDTYGAESFAFSFVELVDNKYQLQDREIYWLHQKQAECIGANPRYAYTYAAPGQGRLTVSKDMRDELKELKIGTIDDTVHMLMKFYNQHSSSGDS